MQFSADSISMHFPHLIRKRGGGHVRLFSSAYVYKNYLKKLSIFIKFAKTVMLKNRVLWDITPLHIPMKVNRCFGGTCLLHLQGPSKSQIKIIMKHVASKFLIDGVYMFPQNVGWLFSHYAALHPKRENSSEPPLWELQIRLFCYWRTTYRRTLHFTTALRWRSYKHSNWREHFEETKWLRRTWIEVLTAVVLKSSIFWDITLKVNRRFGVKYFLNIQAKDKPSVKQVEAGSKEIFLVSSLAYSSTQKTEATCFSETFLDFQLTTPLYVLEDRTLGKVGASGLHKNGPFFCLHIR
jgi:hypothetical protein